MAEKLIYSDVEVIGELKAQRLTVTGQYSLPLTDGAAGQILETDGAGNLNFVSISILALTPASILNGTGLTWTYDPIAGTMQGDVSLAPFNTTNLAEGVNLYFTNERVDDRVAALLNTGLTGTGPNSVTWQYDDVGNTLRPVVSLAPFSTTNLVEGANLYFTNERVDDRVAVLLQPGLIGTGANSISWTYSDILNRLTPVVSLAPFNTTNLAEGANLYFTNERVDDRVSNLIQDTATVTWTYNDFANTLEANAVAPLSVEDNAIFIGSQSTLNFVPGTGTTWTLNNDPINNRVDVQVDIGSSDAVIILDTGIRSSVRRDSNNTASGDYSTVLGGCSNTAVGNCSIVVGGNDNCASQDRSVVVGGFQNNALSNSTFIGGGRDNTISTGQFGVIVGGQCNSVCANRGFIGGGCCNTTSAIYAATVGGLENAAIGTHSFVGGGCLNTANCDYSIVGGGRSNCADGVCSTISGGSNNLTCANRATVGGGAFNCATAQGSTVSGGFCNCAGDNRATVNGGLCNIASGVSSTVSGGSCNTASGTNSTVSGGYCNTVSNYGSTINGGRTNSILAPRSTISGGYCNTLSGGYSSIIGGISNCGIGSNVVIIGGESNTAVSNFSVILGGRLNSANGLFSTASGEYAVAERYGERGHAAGAFGLPGDSMHLDLVLWNEINAGTSSDLFLNGANERIDIFSDSVLSGTINIVGLSDNGTEVVRFLRQFTIQNLGGTTSLNGSIITLGTDHNPGALVTLTITADNTNDALKVNVAVGAITGTTMKFTAHLSAVQIRLTS